MSVICIWRTEMSSRKYRIAAILVFCLGAISAVPQFAESPVSQAKVEYKVMSEFPLEGGPSLVICISPTNRNERDLESLGNTLRVDTENEGFVDVHVYDDEKAARMTERDDLSDEEWAFLSKHEIAEYTRSPKLGTEILNIYFDGIERTINYRK